MLHPSRVVEHQSASSCCAGRCVVVRVHGLWKKPSLCSRTVSHELFGNEMMLLPRLMSFSIKNVSSVRESLIIKNLLLMYKFIKPKILSHVEKNIVLSNSPRECTYASEPMDVNQCNKVDFPCCCCCMPLSDLLSFLVHCCLCIWNQRCLGVNNLSFILLGFPRQASLRDRSAYSCFFLL